MTQNWLSINFKGITIEHLWFVVPFFVTIIRAFRVPLQPMDFWWHLKMGEIIASTHSIPTRDLFSFTASGQPFIIQNWLAEVVYYLFYMLGDLPLVIFLNAVLLGAALLPVFLLCRESTRSNRLAAIATLLAALAFAGNSRPQVFSFVFFSFFYWILDGYRLQRRDRLWLLPAAMIIWVNLHGAFVIGLGLVALYLASETIRRNMNIESTETLSAARLRKLAFTLVACSISTLVNPHTYKVYEYINLILSDRVSQNMVTEWQTPHIGSFAGALFYGIFCLAVLGFFLSRKRINITDVVLILAFSAFGATAYRNTIWFALIAAPVLTRYWTELKIMDKVILNHSASRQYWRFNLMVLGIATLFLTLASPWVRPRLYGTSLLDPRTPVKAIDYIEQHALHGNIFHPQIFGDYLIWRLYPLQRSYFDGRVHLFGEKFVMEYQNVFHDPNWENYLASFNIRYLLLSKEENNSIYMIQMARSSKKWIVLFEDGISILFKRAPES
jgi:hypothetical protein